MELELEPIFNWFNIIIISNFLINLDRVFDSKIIKTFEANNNGILNVIKIVGPLMVILYILVLSFEQ